MPVIVSKAGVQKVTASVKEVELEVGETASVDLVATLSNNTKKDVTSQAFWTTDNSQVAEVDGGEIEGISVGEATITAFYQGYEVIINVNITELDEEVKEVESLQITDKNVKLLVNEEKILNVFALYTDGTREEVSDQVTWLSSKSSVIEVEDGILVANKLGSATITASYEGIETTIKAEVIKDKKIKTLKASTTKVTLKREAETEITLIAYYTDGSKRDVTTLADWKVTKSGIITVEDGVIQAGKKKGTTTITTKYNDRSVNITVTVN
ncbi:Ig-like domain-containing protein [Peribacillus alkalitolerans]|uniref:Ig-like domain-containing protein n=1 Tax=Peribacillus alkalitolerans TaxID=1550385 RepID=UPI001F077E9D|nr:Ig-like domain-containing protein [Peribacillus alkalitolerans]